MRVVIIGAGEVGFSLAQKLIEESHDVIIVEQDEGKAAKADGELDAMVIRGNGARPQVLAKAGVQQGGNVDLLVGCTDRDEVNILACWIAKRAGVKRVISRVRSLEFTDTQAWAHEFGIDLMASPERSVAREIEELLFVQAASYAGELIRGQVGIYAFRVAPDSPVVNATLSDVRKRYSKLRSIIVFIERGDEGFVPSGDSRFCEGDLCY
ncbi:MAG: NAD-binding protein, partial [Candidatus Methanosuratus sp.]|nr:NAD-binding protein [Candidatus Methanosuratincola sp.]